MNVPAEAVEAAARATFERSFAGTSGTWERVAEVGRQDYLEQARTALEAAAPHLTVAAQWSAEDLAANHAAVKEHK